MILSIRTNCDYGFGRYTWQSTKQIKHKTNVSLWSRSFLHTDKYMNNKIAINNIVNQTKVQDLISSQKVFV